MTSAVAALVAWGILAAAGVAHLRDLPEFKRALASQRIWAPWLAMPLATVVALLEAGVGTAGIASLALLDAAALQVVLLMAAGCIYLSYAMFSLYLLNDRPGASCGCSSDSEPVSGIVVARAAFLSGLAFTALINAPVATGLVKLEVIVVVLAAAAYGLTLWLLPAALQDPIGAARASDAKGLIG